MQSTSFAEQALSADDTPAEIVLREARRLHRAAKSDSMSSSLPVLRRLLAARIVGDTSLPEAFRRRSSLQRKHLLRLLAVEAGFPSWERYRPALCHAAASDLDHFAVLETGWALCHHWFSNERDASEHAARFGGRALRIGAHAVVLTPEQVEQYRRLASHHGG